MRRLLQQEAAIFSQSRSTPPSCDIGQGEQEFKRQLLVVICYCVSSDHAYRNSMELFIPIVHTLRHNPAVSREIVRKWRPPVEADDSIVGDLCAALVSLAVVVQA